MPIIHFEITKYMARKMVNTEEGFNAAMYRIGELMAKGSENVSETELAEMKELALLAQAFEQRQYVIEPPRTLAGIIEMKMYELKLKQTDLARKLHVSDTKLSLIMNGKQRPDIDFLKSVHHELNIDANLLLEVI